MMKLQILKEIVIILGIYLLGEFIAYLLGLKYFGALIGMFLLLISLHLNVISVDKIRYVSTFLLGHMPFFFIPAGVSLLANYHLMQGFYIQITMVVMVSTLFVMALSGYIVQLILKNGGKNGTSQ